MSEALFSDAANKQNEYIGARVQELNDLKQFFKIQQRTYIKYKILADSLQEYVAQPELDNLKTKVQDVIMEHSCEQLVHLQADGCEQLASQLLGLSFTNKTELSSEEIGKLNKCMEVMLQAKYTSFCEQFVKLTGVNVQKLSDSSEVTDFSLSSEDQFVLEMVRKIGEQQRKYVDGLLQLLRLLEDISNLRLGELPQVCGEKLKECQMISYMREIQMKIVKEKMRICIFEETSTSLAAFEELIKDIREQQEECKQEINYLKCLKEKYSQVSCKQYEEILKEYVQYKMSLEKKKMILKSFHK